MSFTLRHFCEKTPAAAIVDGIVHVSAPSGQGELLFSMTLRHFLEFVADGAELVEAMANGRNVVSIVAKAGEADK